MYKNEEGIIVLSKDDLNTLISSKNLYFQHPIHLDRGVHNIKDLKEITYYCTKFAKNHDEEEFDEYFTYWNLEEDTPLFDINVVKIRYESDSRIFLSNHSLFGMFWLLGNKLSVGMENVIDRLKLKVPNTDLCKYTENNLRKALLNKDFE